MRCHPLSPSFACLAIAVATVMPVAHADPPRTPGVTCTDGGLNAHPAFTQVSPGRAEYHFSGVCTAREGQFLGYRIDGTWTPSETAPGNANASEIYHVDTLSGPSQTFTAVVGWRCAEDPWLHDVDCARIGDNIPDAPSEFWEEFGRGLRPSSRRGIPSDQRPGLLAEYARANGAFDRSQVVTDTVRDTRGAYRAATVQQNNDTYRQIDAVALNPQPLPPGPPDPDQMAVQPTTAKTGNGTNAAIIIVGGKTLDQRARKIKVRAFEAIPRP